MPTEATVTLRYRDEATVKAVLAAVNPDNDAGFAGVEVSAEPHGSEIRFTVRSRRIGTLIATLDDLLACVTSAEKSIQGAGR